MRACYTSINPLNANPRKMIKQTISWQQPTNCFSVFVVDHFLRGCLPKGLKAFHYVMAKRRMVEAN